MLHRKKIIIHLNYTFNGKGIPEWCENDPDIMYTYNIYEKLETRKDESEAIEAMLATGDWEY